MSGAFATNIKKEPPFWLTRPIDSASAKSYTLLKWDFTSSTNLTASSYIFPSVYFFFTHHIHSAVAVVFSIEDFSTKPDQLNTLIKRLWNGTYQIP